VAYDPVLSFGLWPRPTPSGFVRFFPNRSAAVYALAATAAVAVISAAAAAAGAAVPLAPPS
jgi:hypothetical protein